MRIMVSRGVSRERQRSVKGGQSEQIAKASSRRKLVISTAENCSIVARGWNCAVSSAGCRSIRSWFQRRPLSHGYPEFSRGQNGGSRN